MNEHYPYAAGVYEQADLGWREVEWSRHRTEEAAKKAARRYQRKMIARAGGLLSWSAWHDADAQNAHGILLAGRRVRLDRSGAAVGG